MRMLWAAVLELLLADAVLELLLAIGANKAYLQNQGVRINAKP